jgi:hypothetical protein
MLNKQLLALEKSLGVSALTQIIEPFIQEQKIELYLKRDDLLHPIISGNKWRKLKYILEHVLALNAQKIIFKVSKTKRAQSRADKTALVTRGGEKPYIYY